MNTLVLQTMQRSCRTHAQRSAAAQPVLPTPLRPALRPAHLSAALLLRRRFAQPASRSCRRTPAVCHSRLPRSGRHSHEHPVSTHVRHEAAEPLEVLLGRDEAAASGSYNDSHDDGDSAHSSGARQAQAHHHHHHGPDLDATPVHRALTWIYRHTGLLQLASMLRENTYGSIAISILILVASVTQWRAGSQWLSAQLGHAISSAATAGIYVLAGVPAAVDLTYDLASLHVDTHVLMTLAVIGTLLIGGALEGALLLVLFQVSHTVEHKLTERATGDLAALFEGIPEAATLVELGPGGEPDMGTQRRERAVAVPLGATMLVKPGETVPLDGDIVYGEALVSMQHITGENLPLRRGPGDQVPAGSENHDGVLVLKVTLAAEDSTPARISRLARHAQESKPQLRRWIDEVGEVYSKAVIAATAAALVILPMLGVPLLSTAGQRGAIYRAMGLLTTASPCALVLVPLAYVSAIAAITSRGMLIKGGKVLDALASCKTVAFDKTGTLTTGSLACTGMMSPLTAHGQAAADERSGPAAASATSAGGAWLTEVLQRGSDADRSALAAAIELSLRSNHPVSRAMALCDREAQGQLPTVDITAFKAVPGAGVSGQMSAGDASEPVHVRFGSVAFAAELLPADQGETLVQAAAAVGKENAVSVLLQMLADSQQAADRTGSSVRLFTFQDTLNERSAAAVGALLEGRWEGSRSQRDAKHVVMLTGDNPASAGRVGRLVGISDVRAGLTPEQKLDAVRSLRSPAAASVSGSMDEAHHSDRSASDGDGVIMVGDGINDAPALAAADVGVAIATAPRDAAASAADIILLDGSGVAALPFLLAVAHRTQVVIRQNLCLALGSIAALALPVLFGWLPLWVAVMLHEGSTLLVALNSLRLLRWRDASPSAQPAARQQATSVDSQSRHQQRTDVGAQQHTKSPPPALA